VCLSNGPNLTVRRSPILERRDDDLYVTRGDGGTSLRTGVTIENNVPSGTRDRRGVVPGTTTGLVFRGTLAYDALPQRFQGPVQQPTVRDELSPLVIVNAVAPRVGWEVGGGWDCNLPDALRHNVGQNGAGDPTIRVLPGLVCALPLASPQSPASQGWVNPTRELSPTCAPLSCRRSGGTFLASTMMGLRPRRDAGRAGRYDSPSALAGENPTLRADRARGLPVSEISSLEHLWLPPVAAPAGVVP